MYDLSVWSTSLGTCEKNPDQCPSNRHFDQKCRAEYRRRYHRNPPPRFDRWFNYTTLQGVRPFDDYDTIHHDLIPFWSVPPAELRLRTLEAVSNPWNLIGGIFVRKGRPYVAPFAPPTHEWMLEGIAQMMHPFSKWLPDMEIAFNLNDESRVAMPFAAIAKATQEGLAEYMNSTHGTYDFQVDRGDAWLRLPEEPRTETRFVERSFANSFRTYGIAGCPPKSKAVLELRWNDFSHCTSCAAPHSYQQFLSNWTLAGDTCHQPDLEWLHGTFIAPSTIRNSHDLMPIFSQSKSHGYNDILYPSPWNYEDKATYAPSVALPDLDWSEKSSVLFWRGATTEGFSPGNGAWQHIGRQRFVHMANNATDLEEQVVLLPTDSSQTLFEYRKVTPSRLRKSLALDVHFVEKIDRCWGSDCEIQAREFAPESVKPLPFQSHWQHKYLFDMDGAGFSGRFLPFVNSKSLPFKTAVMREWWDGRLTPWKHFVPVDIRLTEIWSLLAYFQVWKEDESGPWLMKPHDIEAEKIASAGREWAKQTLTKEDMEAYFFRLLLEWGRLTDDKRDELGYAGDLD